MCQICESISKKTLFKGILRMEISTTFTDDMPSVIIESKLQMFLKPTTKTRVAASFHQDQQSF